MLAAQACHDVAVAYGTPFISGKDSLNNEHTHDGKSLSIPPTLLISAIGQVRDVRSCVTMDLKEPGNVLLLLGLTRNELGGSLWCHVHGQEGGRVPRVDAGTGKTLVKAVHAAILRGLLRSCHDLSEGGLAVASLRWHSPVALARSLARGRSARRLDSSDLVLLFSESPTRFLVEARPECVGELAEVWKGLPFCRLGGVTGPVESSEGVSPRLTVCGLDGSIAIDAETAELKAAWQEPLLW